MVALAVGATAASAADAKTLFVQRCSGCHENAATGAPEARRPGAENPRPDHPDAERGCDEPQATGLTATELAAIATYLSVHKAPAAKRSPAPPAAAKTVKKR